MQVMSSAWGAPFSKRRTCSSTASIIAAGPALPAVTDLIKAAPAEGGASKLLGGLASAIGGGKAGGLANLASLAGGFSQLKLDPGMIGKFAPVVLSFLQGKVGKDVVGLVSGALK